MQITEPITATAIETTYDRLAIVIGDRRVRIPWEQCSSVLANATQLQRLTAQLSPGGCGIHWPLLDEDMSVRGLLRKA